MKDLIIIVREVGDLRSRKKLRYMMTNSSSWDQLKFLVRRNNNQPTTTMTENLATICKFPVILFGVSLLFCFISFVLCIVAELLRNKQDDIRWSGRLCYAALSPSYWLGIAALCCLALSQLLASFIFFNHSSKNPEFNIPVVAKLLVLISWLSCGVAIVILTVAISMSGEQNYGEGWLEGDCYVVKPGCFVASSILLLLSLASIFTSSFSTIQIHPN